ncbi:MAG TPA: hypothetical protein PK076_14120 [Saprospiraceae bacterium]|nr:hypothetical protein [Saprospiraceae bacterium]HQW57266.1 hypothetical protein [Saprospiraceae bacterium]
MKPHNFSLCLCIMLLSSVVLSAQNEASKIDSLQQVIIQHRKIDSLERVVDQLESRTKRYGRKDLSLSREKNSTIRTMVSGIILTTGGAVLLSSYRREEGQILDTWKTFAIFNGIGLLVPGLILTSSNVVKLIKLNKDSEPIVAFGTGQHGIGMVIAIR